MYRLTTIISLLAITTGSIAEAQQADERQIAFFEKHVRPLLVKQCYECHSKNVKSPRGNLLLDSKAGWQAGGDLGPAIVPGKPDASLLIKAVRYADENLQMPPDGKLSDAEIATLTGWIKMGAPDPRTGASGVIKLREVDIEKGRQFWAFKPPVMPNVPLRGHGRLRLFCGKRQASRS